MNGIWQWLAPPLSMLLGACGALLWRARREQTLHVENELLRERLQNRQNMLAEQESSLARTREQLRGAFGELARDSLRDNNEVFLQLARERMARQEAHADQALHERQSAIEALLEPIRASLTQTAAQVHSIERDRIDSFAALKNQIEGLAGGQSQLSRETRNLVTALQRPQVRGQWGEITLRRLVELSGMSMHVDFSEQAHRSTGAEEHGRSVRPDLIVHLPEQREIIIDVKTPLEAYLAAVEAPDDIARRSHLRRHAQLVAGHVRELASKQYWTYFERSPEFVVLFLPGDQFLAAALQENPDLVEEALRQNVMLATPTSLVALLKAVSHGWKQTVLAENAAEIRRLGEDLHKRLSVFAEHLCRLGKSLGNSVESFNKAVGSLEQQVLPAARRFPDLGLRINRTIDLLEPVERLVRSPRDEAPAP